MQLGFNALALSLWVNHNNAPQTWVFYMNMTFVSERANSKPCVMSLSLAQILSLWEQTAGSFPAGGKANGQALRAATNAEGKPVWLVTKSCQCAKRKSQELQDELVPVWPSSSVLVPLQPGLQGPLCPSHTQSVYSNDNYSQK